MHTHERDQSKSLPIHQNSIIQSHGLVDYILISTGSALQQLPLLVLDLQTIMQKGQSRTQLTYQKPNNSLNHAEQKYDSIVVAREIILGEQTKIGKWLWQFKQFKNPNYQKFTEKVHNHLKNNKFTFGRSVERFMAISCIADQENTTYFQMCSILKGFSKFWKAVETSYQSMRHLFRHIVDVYNPISSNFVKCCREIIQTRLADKQQDFKKVALELTNTFIKSSKKNGEYKAIALINEFNLFAAVSIAKVIDLLIREPNTRDILYVFVDSQGQKKLNMVKMFIDRCVSNQSKNDLAKCQRVIKELQLNPLNYPNYIRRLLQKYISYQLRAYKLFNIELVIQHDLELIHVLIGELRRQKRIREMRYFIVKYGLQKDYNLNIDQKQRQDLIQIKNVLIDCDHFGPTEVEVLQVQVESKKYLYVKDFGLKQKDIIIVNKSNLKQIKIEEEFREKKVGIDSERSGGIHVFDSCQTEILQIYTGKRVLIFDYQQVQKEPHFKQIFTFILSQCEIYGQDIQKQLAEFRKEMELPLQENIFQQTLKNRVIDSAKYFKQMFPKETKCNLAYMCQVVFSKILSKYEQCSGWRNRPLRKAQLHYAALDCIVPVKLCEQLSKINKK